MRTRSLKFITPMLLSTLVACSGPKDNATLMSEAIASIENGNSAEAVINLKNIIKNDLENIEARFLLGKIYYTNDNFLGAEKEFKKVLANDKNHQGATLLLSRTQLSLNQHENTLATLENKTFDDNDDKTHALLIQAQAYLALNNISSAKTTIAQATSINKDSKYTLLGQALILAFEKETTKALTLLDSITTKNKHFNEAWLLKGSVHAKANNFEEAANAYEEYYKLKPKNFAIRTLVAHNLIRAGKFEQAQPHVDALIKVNDKHPTVALLAAQIAFSKQDYEKSKELANEVVNATNNGLAQMVSGLSSYFLNENEQAYYQLNAISDLLPKSHQVHKILAILQVKLGYTDDLSDTLSGMSSAPESNALLYANLGQEYAKKGDTANARDMLSKAANLAPDNAQIKAQLGMLKLSDDSDAGVKELEEAISLDPQFKSANIVLAMKHANSGDIEKAEAIAHKWLTENPDSVAALILNGNIALKAKKIPKAKEYFNLAIKQDDKNVIPLFNLAVIAASAKDYVESTAFLNKILAIDLEYPYTYPLIISNAVADNKEAQLEQQLADIINDNPKALWPRIILARRYTMQNQPQKSLDILNGLDDYAALTDVYFQALTNALIMNKEEDKLNELFRNWQVAQSQSDKPFLTQIDYLDNRGKYQEALQVTDRALTMPLFKNHLQLQSLNAYYLLATKQFELASQKINSLAKSNPEHSFILRLQGQLAMSREQYDNAVNYLKSSYNKTPKNNTAVFLINSYKKAGKHQEAIGFLEKLLKEQPKNTVFKSFLAELNIDKNPESAIEGYKEVLKSRPNDAVILNNIAWIYYQKSDTKEALEYVDKALASAPKHPQILDTKGLILLKKGDIKKAIDILKTANEISPADKDIATHLAQAYEANNQPELAKALLSN